MADDRSPTLRYLPITREAAWRHYLDAVRGAAGNEYAEVEQAAWAELQAALERIPSHPAGAA
jgi:phage-related protein